MYVLVICLTNLTLNFMFKRCKFRLNVIVCSVCFKSFIKFIVLSHKAFDGIINPRKTVFWSAQFSGDKFIRQFVECGFEQIPFTAGIHVFRKFETFCLVFSHICYETIPVCFLVKLDEPLLLPVPT